MQQQQKRGHSEFNQGDALNIKIPRQLLPFFLKEQSKRAVHHKHDARPKKNCGKNIHNQSGESLIAPQEPTDNNERPLQPSTEP